MKTSVIAAVVFIIPVLTVSAVAAEITVGQQDKQFSQESVAIRKGDKIRFINNDTVTHNITIKDPSGATKSGIIEKPGDEVLEEFGATGDYEVRCLIHPKMKLTVKVE
jgi:plastocyanin